MLPWKWNTELPKPERKILKYGGIELFVGGIGAGARWMRHLLAAGHRKERSIS